MHDKSDASSIRSATAANTVPEGPVAAFYCAELATEAPSEITAHGTKTWLVRGQNFVLAYSAAQAGDTLARVDQPDEYVVVLPDDDATIDVCHGREVPQSVTGCAVVVVPGGDSELVVTSGGHIVRLFSIRSSDLAEASINANSYLRPHANVTPFEPWPDPVDGARIRTYRIADIPPDPDRFGRIFRCSTFMVNFLYPHEGPRDATKMSPHHHEDFEQCSLATRGEFIHHVRTPWSPRMAEWREDEHVACGSPSVAVIPPPTIHTSQAVGPGTNQLIDIFCPPRRDFSSRAGWVLNADLYPER